MGNMKGAGPKPKHQEKWYANLEEYKNWVEKHGELPSGSSQDKHEVKLENWMTNNRLRYRNGKLGKDREEALNNLNPIFLSNTSNIRKDYEKQQFEQRNSIAILGDHESLQGKGLTEKGIKYFNSEGMYCISDVIKLLRKLYDLEQSNLPSDKPEIDRLRKVLNIESDKKDSIELYSLNILHSILKRLNPNIRYGDILLLRSIRYMEPQDLLFSNRYIFTGIEKRIDEVIDRLKPREKTAIKMVYYSDTYKTYSEIGKELNVCGARVRQIVFHALRKLRNGRIYAYIRGKQTS